MNKFEKETGEFVSNNFNALILGTIIIGFILTTIFVCILLTGSFAIFLVQ